MADEIDWELANTYEEQSNRGLVSDFLSGLLSTAKDAAGVYQAIKDDGGANQYNQLKQQQQVQQQQDQTKVLLIGGGIIAVVLLVIVSVFLFGRKG